MLLTPLPSNVKLSHRMRGKQAVVDSDLYGIAERIKKELSPNLVIVFHADHKEPFVVMENCIDGTIRFVKRYAELDARIIDDLRYMISVPFEERLRKAEAEEKENNDAIGAPDPEKQERFTHEMGRELVRANILDPLWSTNYPLVPAKHRRVAN